MPILSFQYCLTCGRLVPCQGEFHITATPNYPVDRYDYKECSGPFAATPPPDDLPEDWQDSLSAPSFDDLGYSRHIDYDVETDQNILLYLI